MADTIPTTCEQNGGAVIVFDAPTTDPEDEDTTWMAYEVLNAAAGA